MIELYSGRTFVGTIIRHRGGFSARDAQGERVGNFGTEASAVDALLNAHTDRRAAGGEK